MKRILSFLLALCLMFGQVPAAVFAAEPGTAPDETAEIHEEPEVTAPPVEEESDTVTALSGQCGDNVYWNLSDDGVLTISGTGPMWDYAQTVDNQSPWHGSSYLHTVYIEEGVTTVGDNAFLHCNKLFIVTIPKSVTTIGAAAFRSCDKLYLIHIAEGVTSIEGGAFSDCTDLCKIELPNSLTHLGTGVFSGCTSLSSINIPEGITRINGSTFAKCSSLKTLILPDSITSIGSEAFAYSGLRLINLPDNLTTIEYRAFAETSLHGPIVLPAGITSIAEGLFSGCSNLKEVVIPDGVTSIGKSAFQDSIVSSIVIPDSVTTIGASAFANTRISSIIIPDSVTAISDDTFRNSYLEYFEIPDSITSIGYGAFAETDLEYIKIPSSVTSVGSSAFSNCEKLRRIEVDENNPAYSHDEFGTLYDKAKTKIVRVPGAVNSAYYIPDTVTVIGNGAFAYCNLLKLKLTIPDSVVTIEDLAFYYSSLRHVEIGNGVTSIGTRAFYFCDALDYVLVGNSVATIGDEAFRDSDYIDEIIFLGDAPEIGSSAFTYVGWDNGGKSRAYYPAYNPTWTPEVIEGYINSSVSKLTWVPYCPGTDVTVPDLLPKGKDNMVQIKPLEVKGSFSAPIAGSNEILKEIPNVTITSALGTEEVQSGGFSALLSEIADQDIRLTAPEYRDYVIPAAVCASLRSEKNHVPYVLNAYMQKDKKDGKPYISTVFGRDSGHNDPYVDLRSTELVLTDGSTQDIIVTALGFDTDLVTYFIAQDQDRIVHSNTGIFSAVDLFHVFDEYSTVYVYARFGNLVTEPQKIRLSKDTTDYSDMEDFFTRDNISLLGKDTLKITIPDDVPVFGGMDVNLDGFTLPVGVEMHGPEFKFTLGFDLFKATKDLSSEEKKTTYNSFKETAFSLSEQYKYSPTSPSSLYKEYFSSYFVKNNDKLNLSPSMVLKESRKNTFAPYILGYVEGKFVRGEFVVKESLITLGFKSKFSHTAQGVAWFIPVYGSIEFGVDSSGTAKITRYLPMEDIPYEFDMTIKVDPSCKISGGAGVKNVIAGGLYGKGNVPIVFECFDHLTIDFVGEIGVETEFFVLGGDKPIIEREVNLIDKYFNVGSTSVNAVTILDDGCPDNSATVTTVVSRDYAENTSEWLGDWYFAPTVDGDGSAVAAKGVSFRDLQTSIFANSQPQLVTVGDQMLLTWIEDDLNRDIFNRMRLVYSVYDPMMETWSEPQPVWDDGHNDGYPILVSDGETAYVLWQKVNTTLTEENTTDIDTALENSELCLAKFETGAFVDAQMLTSDSLYEYAHNVVLVDGEPVVFWASSTENAMNVSGNNALFHWENGTTEELTRNLNYVLSIDAIDGEVTYVMDADGELDTTADVTAFTISDVGTTTFDNSEMGAAITWAGYAPLDGEEVLFLSDMGNIYYEQDGELKSVLSGARTMGGNLNIVETDLGTAILWTEQVEGWNELFAATYEDGIWSESVQISENGELLTKITAVCYDGKLTGICNTNSITYDESTDTYIKGETDLALFTVNDFSDIELGSYLTINEEELEIGEETELYVTVYNNGTLPVDEVTFTITDTLGTLSEQTVYIDIPSGGSEIVTLTYPVPESYTSTTLTVTAAIDDTDANEEDNTVSLEIGNHDLSVTETAVEMLEGGYLLKAVIENGSLVDAEKVTLSVSVGNEESAPLETVTVGTIARENYALAEILLAEESLTFDENGAAKVYLKLNADGTESADADNSICIIVTEAAETVCMHPVTETVEKLDATCTEPGHEAYEACAACGEAMSEIVEIPAGHLYETVVIAPTCTTYGHTTHTCSRCGDSYADELTVPTDHNYEAEIILPTCEDPGYTVLTCTICGRNYNTDYVAAVDHNYEIVVTPPTCEEQGYTTYTCSGCGDSYVTDYVNATGHSYESEIIPPSCESQGYTTHICSVCGDSYVTDYVNATGHSYESEIIPPSCESQGYTTHICSGCGHSYTTDYINPSDHTYENGFCTVCGAEDPSDIVGIASGTCGENVYWILAEDGTLIIHGTGPMTDYFSTTSAPWNELRDTITAVEIRKGVTAIGDHAFYNCNNLIRANIPGTVIKIGKYSFEYCSSLTRIDIPASVTTIVDKAFFACQNLEGIFVDNDNTVYCNDRFGVLLSKDQTILYTAPGSISGHYTIPDTVTQIGSHAFYSCTKLISVTMPDRLEIIDSGMFAHCTSLEQIDLPDNLTQIGYQAFYNCFALRSITIPASTEEIGSEAFYSCSSLSHVVFQGNAPTIAEDAFEVVTTTAYYPADNSTWTEEAMQQYEGILTWIPIDSSVITSGTCGDHLTWMLTKDGVLTISGEGAMTNFTDGMEAPWMAHTDLFTSVVIEEGVTTVGIRAFANAMNVTSVELPISLTDLGEEAFYMSGLTELTLPPNLSFIGSKSMVCPNLTGIYVEDEAHATCYSRNGVLYTANSLVQVPGAYTGELELHSNTWNIWDCALMNCQNLTKLILPANIDQIGADILDGCTSLTEIQFQGDAPGNVFENTFEGVTATISYPDANTTWTEEVKQFFGDNLTWTTHGENLVAQGYCGENALSNRPQVGTNADMPAGENATWVLTADGTMTISGEGKMGNFILFVGSNPWAAVCMNDPTRLTRVVIEEGITTVGEFAFADILGEYITEVILPSTMERISLYAFAFCDRLEKIHLPEGIVEIGSLAFAGCPALTEIQFLGDAPSIAGDAFNSVVATAYYPVGNTTWTEEVMQNYGGTITWESYTPAISGACGDNLTWILEDGVLTISGEGDMWDFGEENTVPWYDYIAQVTALDLEEGITGIGDYAFCLLPISSVTVPETVTYIGDGAFSYTMGMGSAVLPESLTSIGDMAFFMSALCEVTIPAGVTSIGLNVFANCPLLTAIHVDEGNSTYYSWNGMLYESFTLLQVPGGCSGEVELHPFTYTIGDGAFMSCERITKLVIPSNTYEIGKDALSGCSGLTEILFHGSVPTTVGENAFNGVTAVISHPNANTTWTAEAKQLFGESITWTTYGEDLVAWGICGENAIYDENGQLINHYSAHIPADNVIWKLTADGTMTVSGEGAMMNCVIFGGFTPWYTVFELPTRIVIEEGITYAGEFSFMVFSEVTELVLPTTLQRVGAYAFNYMEKLEKVTIPEGTTVIPDILLAYNAALTSLDIPASVTSIGSGAVGGCTALAELRFHGDAPAIAEDAFADVVATAYYPAGNPTWTTNVMQDYGGTITWKPVVNAKVVTSGWSGATTWKLYDNGTLVVFGNGKMKNYDYDGGQPWLNQGVDITNVIVTEGVTGIGSGAFRNLTTLKSVTFPATTLTQMGEAAFYGSGLESVEIPASLWTIQPYTFKNCVNLTSVKFNEGNLEKISDGAFYGTGLTELVLPDCLDILDTFAFKGCKNLTSITIGSGLTELREAVFYGTAIPTITIPEGITKIGPYAFKNCVKLETIELPESLTSVGEASFYDCAALKAIDLPDAVTSVGNYAFRRCIGLTSTTFGENLVTVGECAFYGCTGLTELVIPDKVTTIKPYAFKTCTGLTSITLGNSVETIGEGAFNTCTGIKTIVFPASLKTIGDYCFSGSVNLWKLTFQGDAPAIGTGAFKGLDAYAYYPGDNATWTAENMLNYGGKIEWKAN